MTGRWLVTGAGGMLGHAMVDVLAAGGVPCTALRRAELDITDAAATRAAVEGHDVVVNTAGWTDVDRAEAEEATATLVNGAGAGNVAAACAATGARLLHVSTDYVFAGDARRPYPEDAPTGPVSAYGRGKVAGELAVRGLVPHTGYIVRTGWLYGAHGPNFVTTMLRLAATRDTVEVVDDQCGQPTWTRALAGQLVDLGRAALAGAAPPGVYHGTATGETTRYELARAVFAEAGLDPGRVRPTTSDRFPLPARRPAYSVLGHDRWARAGLSPLPHWRTMLTTACAEPGLLTEEVGS